MKQVSRIWIIRQLCRKEYGAKRPTAIQINKVIEKYNLNRYTADGKKRTKDVIKEYIQKAYKKLN